LGKALASAIGCALSVPFLNGFDLSIPSEPLMQPETEQLAQRIATLETALERERSDRDELSAAIENETFQRREALLLQEHRLVFAARSLYRLRTTPHLRWAAAGGLLSAFIGRSTATAIAGGGLLALIVTAMLTVQANYLLALQNQRMDVQTIVMDAQRRTQNFQAEFSAISTEVASQLAPLRDKQSKAKEKLKSDLFQPATQLASLIEASETGMPALDLSLRLLSSDLRNLTEDSDWYSNGGFRKLLISVESMQRQLPYQMKEKLKLDNFSVRFRNIKIEYDKDLGDRILDRRRSNFLDSDDQFFDLDSATRLRIAGLSQAVRPSPIVDFDARPHSVKFAPGIWNTLLRYFEDPSFGAQDTLVRLSEQKTSPERGQLLTFLMAQSVWLPRIFEAGADFGDSDLSSRTLGPIDFGTAKFQGANFTGTRFQQISFRGDFRKADFRCARFSGGSLEGALLAGATFAGASFGGDYQMVLSSKVLAETDLDQASLANALLSIPERIYESMPAFRVEEAVTLGEVLAHLEPEKKIDLTNRYQRFVVHKLGAGPWRISNKDDSQLQIPFCQSLGLQPYR
jgi:uncharacterized protein YjbI with pentapeptide repeats